MGSGFKCQLWTGSLVHRTETSQTETSAVLKGSQQLPIDALTFTLLQLTSLRTSIHPAPDPACGCRQEGERRIMKTTRPDIQLGSGAKGQRRSQPRCTERTTLSSHLFTSVIELNPSAISRIVCPGWTFMTLISLFNIFVSGIKEACTFVIRFLSP